MNPEKKWYALLTRSHFEKHVCTAVEKKSVEIFLPTIKKPSQRKDRRIMIDAPLFPGYVFINISEEPGEQLTVLKTPGAVRILGYNNCPIAIPSAQIDSLRIITGQDNTVITGSEGLLEKGEAVLVTQGPFAGLQGEFLRYKGTDRVMIRVQTLGQFAGVEICREDIEKLPEIMS
ncbi:MAG: UpxY family transcription antiterminator [Desulfobacteraceae bacterium]